MFGLWKEKNDSKAYLPIIKKALLVLLCSVLILSCSKDDNGSNREKEHEGYRDDGGNNDSEGYNVSVKSPGEDKYVHEVVITDFSKSQSLKWNVSFQQTTLSNYFNIYPTGGKGSGSFYVRITDTNSPVLDCPVDISFVTGSGKTSVFSPHVSFYHLQSLFSKSRPQDPNSFWL